MSYKKLTTIPPGTYIEIDTDAGMSTVLTSANIGKCYKFTGTTGNYTNGSLYLINSNIAFEEHEDTGTIGSGSYIFRYYKLVEAQFNWGDGSLNKTVCGYTDVQVYDEETQTYSTAPVYSYSYNFGNSIVNFDSLSYTTPIDIQHVVTAGTNTYTFPTILTGDGLHAYGFAFWAGGLTTGVDIGSFTIRLNGTDYSLKQAVEASMIRPLVLTTCSYYNSSQCWTGILNLYDNSGTAGSANWPISFYWIVPMDGVTWTAATFYASKAFNTTYDGYCVRKLDDIVCLAPQ